MRNSVSILLAAMVLTVIACSKEEVKNPLDSQGPGKEQEQQGQQEQKKEEDTRKYANIFARNTMDIYYLWNEEIQSHLNSWKMMENPIEKVKSSRYSADRWTELMDDYEEFSGRVEGISKSYGYELIPAYVDDGMTVIVAGVLFTYGGSPAHKAGLNRGDIIIKVNGRMMTPDNYQKIFTDELYGGSSVTLTINGGRTVTLYAEPAAEDPVNVVRTFTLPGGGKVGYLHYTQFTMNSYKRLIEACSGFKREKINELILDLRYNGGGDVDTEHALASMLAPEDKVAAGSVFETEVYNRMFSEALSQSEKECRFTTEYNFRYNNTEYKYSTKDANTGITGLHVIMTENSASASEALVCGLKPYLPIKIYGSRTHGKFCAGTLISGQSFYKNFQEIIERQYGADAYKDALEYMKNWGIYVMVCRYADKDGYTACMPDGLDPNVPVEDDPWDGYALGDPNETMLKAVLSGMGYEYKETKSALPVRKKPVWQTLEPVRDASFGIMLTAPPSLPQGQATLR